MNTVKVDSPRLRKLYEDIKINKEESLQLFWEEVKENGAPLIEEIEGDNENCLVTLLWREVEPIDNIRVIGEIFGMDPDFTKFYRMAGTDLHFRSWKVNKGAHGVYIFILNGEDNQDWSEFNFVVDPLNPQRYVCIEDDKNPEPYLLCKEESYIALPDYKENNWTIEEPQVNKGKVEVIEDFESSILNNKRRIWMYTPASYDKNSNPCSLAIFTDGWHYVHVTKVITILDKLISKGEISPVCVAFIEAVDRDTELTCSEKFSDLVTKELLPFIYEKYNVTRLAESTLIGGFSYGGLNASFIGAKYPEIFGKVFCQSGAMYWTYEEDENQKGKIIQMYQEGHKLPLDFYMTFGEYEKDAIVHYNANKEFAKLLEDKGYTYKYKEFLGSHTYMDLDMELANGFKFLLGNNIL
ncbi:enterochelin esterase family protein [Clostridium punense]|uniref:Enterochelin esterase family protein n=1 Tax=Clostridium punense TaxID=1054297 RepID=A0ABS4K4S2_9CLOT|nr:MULTISPECIES: alpha/beta hydrolase-fold protein [Clostridium]EQB88019.1 hypothetical protein M918_06395 [Clostridium sp. BL8]MBP2021634.1 enterochelin esterase family protein [Clostridium punense]